MEFWPKYGWIVQIGILLVGALVVHLLVHFILSRLGRRHSFAVMARSLFSPVLLLIWVLAITWIIDLLVEHFWSEQELVIAMWQVRRVAALIATGWFLIRWKTLAVQRLCERQKIGNVAIDRGGVEAVGKLISVFVVVIITLMALATVGVDITALVALGGLGTIAIGIAGKDVLANCFGGLMHYLNRPFHVGEVIALSGKGIEGRVERIGWYMTSLRGIDQRPVYVPNSLFSTSAVVNNTRMVKRRIETTLGLRYQDFEHVPKIVNEIGELLKGHEAIDSTLAPVVKFTAFGSYSLDLFLRAFTKSGDWFSFLDTQQEILLEIGKIVHRNNADFAFPTTALELN